MPTPKPYRVTLCGDSILVTGLGYSLQTAADIELQRVNPRQPDALAQLVAWQPDVVLVEYGERVAEDDQFILALLHVQPALPLIGLDAQRSVLTLLTSRQVLAAGVAEVLRVIRDLFGEQNQVLVNESQKTTLEEHPR